MGFSISGVREAPLADLVTVAQADPSSDSIVMNEIVRRFESKARGIARDLTTDVHLQHDIANAGLYAVVTAVRAHNPAVQGFAAYVVRTMRGEARRVFSRAIRPREVSTPADAEVWAKSRAPELSLVVNSDLAVLMTDLSIEQRTLTFARYVEDVPLVDLARVTGTSKSALSHRFTTIHRTIRSTINHRLVTA